MKFDIFANTKVKDFATDTIHYILFIFGALFTCSSIMASDRLFLSLMGRSPITGLFPIDIFVSRSPRIRALGVDMIIN